MFEIHNTKDGGFFWRLKASNGETLCHSEVFTSKQSAEQSIAAAKRVIPVASVKDLTMPVRFSLFGNR